MVFTPDSTRLVVAALNIPMVHVLDIGDKDIVYSTRHHLAANADSDDEEDETPIVLEKGVGLLGAAAVTSLAGMKCKPNPIPKHPSTQASMYLNNQYLLWMLPVSVDGQWFASGDTRNRIHIFNTDGVV
jgi:hypothetical protein